MDAERADRKTSVVDVRGRLLNRGIVNDACVCVSLVGIELLRMGARVVVTPLEI